MELIEVTELASIIVSIAFLSVSSIYDLKTREVEDWMWLAYGPIGLALTILRLFLNPSNIVITLIAIAVGVVISLALGYFGLFGGADAKAMICLSVTLPVNPTTIHPILGYVHPFFPVVVVIEAFFCSASLAVWFGLTNLFRYLRSGKRMFEGLESEPWWRKAVACVLGYPVSLAKLQSQFYLYPIEEMKSSNGVSERSFRLYVSAETDRDQLVSELSNSLTGIDGKSTIWVTPGIPMLLFILIALILALVFGDAIFSTVLRLARR